MTETVISNEDLRKFISHCLPDKIEIRSIKQADALFQKIDIHKNGFASLAQIDKGIRQILQVPEIPGLHTMLLRSYDMARSVKKSQLKVQNDYLTKDEFIYMLIYLRVYYEIYIEFRTLDLNADGQINFAQLQKGKGILLKWGIDTSNMIHLFTDIDTNSGGTISFRQFCEWCLKKYFNLEFGTPISD